MEGAVKQSLTTDDAGMCPPMTALVEREGGSRYLADRFEWAAPGDQQEDAWLVRFCDRDCGEAIFTGPDAEAEAWAYWERYAPSFNIYVFRLAALRQPGPEYRRAIEDAARAADRHDTGDCTREDMEARRIATAIRALSDSIPDTKGGRDGE